MKLRKGWALIDPLDDVDPRLGKMFREFEIFDDRKLALSWRLKGQLVVPVEYRFPKRKK